jgi:hypothetical protein
MREIALKSGEFRAGISAPARAQMGSFVGQVANLPE